MRILKQLRPLAHALRIGLILTLAATAVFAQTADSVAPTSGNGVTQTFTAVYSDAAGATTLNRRLFLINSSQIGASGCFVQVDPTGTYLANDADSVPLMGPLGAGQSLMNSQCSLTGASVSNSGNSSTVTLTISFRPSFIGVKNIYLYADDTNGHNSGFQTLGTYTVGALNVDSVAPSAGSGMSQVFTAVYSDATGVAAIKRRLFLIGSNSLGTGGCLVQVDATGIYLANDAGSVFAGPLTGLGRLANSQCALNGPGTSVTDLQNRSTVKLSLSFNTAFTGTKNIYLYDEDYNGHNSGFQALGNYTVGVVPAPTVDSVTPVNATGTTQVFTAVFSDPAGGSTLDWRVVLFSSAFVATNSCGVRVLWDGTYLVDDTNSFFYGPVTSTGTISNSQCTINGAGTSVQNSGNTSTVTLSITFKPGFAGAKNIYMYDNDLLGRASDYAIRGAYTVAGPAVIL